jgi:hypothetical protein
VWAALQVMVDKQVSIIRRENKIAENNKLKT